jgi:hypothetical protein
MLMGLGDVVIRTSQKGAHDTLFFIQKQQDTSAVAAGYPSCVDYPGNGSLATENTEVTEKFDSRHHDDALLIFLCELCVLGG